jgi:hypothetical protein
MVLQEQITGFLTIIFKIPPAIPNHTSWRNFAGNAAHGCPNVAIFPDCPLSPHLFMVDSSLER